MDRGPEPRRTDPILLVEAALALLFFGLMVALYLIPSTRAPFRPWSWTGLLVAALFFAIVGLDAWRRRRRGRSELRRAIREDAERQRREGELPAP